MTRQLRSKRRGAAKGTATNMVVFVHGYGAGGEDLMNLADPLGPHMPGTVFYAPDAPLPEGNAQPMGRSWFPVPRFDGSSEEEARAALLAAADDLNAFLDARLDDEGLEPEALALVGFSQGSMMSLHISPRRPEPVGAVIAISGRLVMPEALAQATQSRPPILLMHGDVDDVVPFEEMARAADALVQAEFEVYTHVMQGMAHGISEDGLGNIFAFLQDKLPQ